MTDQMYKNLEDNPTEIRNFAQSSDIEELSKFVTSRICRFNAQKILNYALEGLSKADNFHTKRRILVESILKSLKNTKVTVNHVESIINRIIIDFPEYPKQSLLKLVEFCLQSIKNNDDEFTSWKDILPVLLETLREEKYINYRGTEVSGVEYKCLIVKEIIIIEWDSSLAISLAKMFREMSLEKSQLDTVMRALCNKLPECDLNEIPPLIHQLLRLGEDNRIVFTTLFRYFSQKYSEATADEDSENYDKIGEISLKEVQDGESTVLYYIYQAVQTDHKILKDFIRLLKSVTNSPEFILDPFIISVLLTNADVFEDLIYEVLKTTIIRKIQEEEKCRNSAWLRQLISNKNKVMDVIDNVIKNSNDRPMILQSLVNCAFILMGTEKKNSLDEAPLWEIGSKMVHKIVRKVHSAEQTIVQHLTDRIISCGSSVSQYTDCLAYLCRKMTLTLIDNQRLIVTLLEQFLSLPGGVAMQVLFAISPLMKTSNSIRDSLVLVLRKALTQRDTYTRQMAILGFLQLLTNLKVSSLNALSQGHTSSSTTSASSFFTQAHLEKEAGEGDRNPEHNIALCQELLSILRRCFIYDSQVRLCLYEGLYDAVVVNQELAEYVNEMLLEHFLLFYEGQEDILPPFNYEKCTITQGAEEVLQEPLGELVFLIQKIYIKTALKNYISVNQFSVILESLCRRMSQIEAEHLNLNELTDLLDNDLKSQKTLHHVKLTISVCEALIAYRFGTWSMDSVNHAQSVNSLFKIYLRFSDFLKKSNKLKKGEIKGKTDKDTVDRSIFRKMNRNAILKLHDPVIKLDTVYKMLSLLYENNLTWTTKAEAEVLRKRIEFHHYVLQTSLQLIRNVKSSKGNDLKRHKKEYSKIYIDIGRLIFKRVILKLENTRDFDEETSRLALECFKDLCDLMCNSLVSELSKFLFATSDANLTHNLSSQIESLLTPLKVVFVSTLNQEDDENPILKKMNLSLIETISLLIHKIPFEEDVKGDELQNWLRKVSEKENIDQSIRAIVIQLILYVEEHTHDFGDNLYTICENINQYLTSDSPSNPGIFGIINKETCRQILPVIHNALKFKLNNVVWLLARIKAEQAVTFTPGMEEERGREQLKEKEKSLCYHFGQMIKILELLVKSCFNPGPDTDAILRNVQQAFNILSNLTKYFTNKISLKNTIFESIMFTHLVELAGRRLKPEVEEFIRRIEDHKMNDENKNSDMSAKRNKILKETKLIPRVVYEIEQFNKDILTLSKKSGVELDKHIKHSKARDFRINKTELEENLVRTQANPNLTYNSTRAEEDENINEESDTENETTSD